MANPIIRIIKAIYTSQSDLVRQQKQPCPLNLELLASFERLLCYCHTGNTAVLATSLMHPLGLSRATLTDGFPMLLNPFQHPTIFLAIQNGLKVDPSAWPLKNGYPAVASRKAQIFTYSLNHFFVSLLYSFLNPYLSILSYLSFTHTLLILSFSITHSSILGISSYPPHLLCSDH